jgi:hypothetical protein
MRKIKVKILPTNITMPRIVRRLPVATTSKPDLVPLYTTQGLTQMQFGEFKNANNYNADQARAQCQLYLLGLLYFLRVAGNPVETVYGFYFCGCKCADQHGNEVGIISLSAPQFLGDPLESHYFQIKSNVGKFLPLCLLVHFLKNGKKWPIAADSKIQTGNQSIPSLLSLPASLWKDVAGQRILVWNAAHLRVFKITAAALKCLLEEQAHFRTKLSYQGFHTSVSNLLDASEEDQAATTKRYYCLKIHVQDAS